MRSEQLIALPLMLAPKTVAAQRLHAAGQLNLLPAINFAPLLAFTVFSWAKSASVKES